MKLQPITTMPPNPRALLIYDADREIDTAHPLWNEIMLYGQALDEVHVFIFIRHLPSDKARVVNLSPNVFAYYMPADIFWLIDALWPMVKYHLIWKAEFRPHFVLNFSTHSGALFGLLLAKRYGCRFFMSTTGSFLDMPLLSPEYFLNYLLVRGAQRVFVPGERIAGVIASHIGARRVSVVRPAIDLSFLERKIHAIQYQAVHPQHNFFLLTRTSIGRKRELGFIVKVFSEISTRYPRTALIVIVPSAQVAAVKRFFSRKHARSIYVYAESDDGAAYIVGANIFLSVSESEENIIPVIQALNLHVPVVAAEAGMIRELFAGSPYEASMKPFGDVQGFCTAIATLINDQRLRDDYRLNSTILLKSLSVQNLQGHIALILRDIVEVQ